jgi:hypothetical protein
MMHGRSSSLYTWLIHMTLNSDTFSSAIMDGALTAATPGTGLCDHVCLIADMQMHIRCPTLTHHCHSPTPCPRACYAHDVTSSPRSDGSAALHACRIGPCPSSRVAGRSRAASHDGAHGALRGVLPCGHRPAAAEQHEPLAHLLGLLLRNLAVETQLRRLRRAIHKHNA